METEKLETIVLAIDAAAEDRGWNEGHLLVGVAAEDDEGATIGTMAFDVHPLEILDGMKAPDDWLAIGVCCEGWAARLDSDSGSRPSQSKGRMRVRNTVIVSREGAVAAAMRLAGEEPKLMPEGVGAVLDALRSAIGLVNHEVA